MGTRPKLTKEGVIFNQSSKKYTVVVKCYYTAEGFISLKAFDDKVEAEKYYKKNSKTPHERPKSTNVKGKSTAFTTLFFKRDNFNMSSF